MSGKWGQVAAAGIGEATILEKEALDLATGQEMGRERGVLERD